MNKLLLVGKSDTLEPLANMLRAKGYEVACAYNRFQGLMMARTHMPAIALVDVAEIEGGYQLIGWLKYNIQINGRVTVLAIVDGNKVIVSSEKENVENAGADDCIVKPLIFAELLEKIEGLLIK
jgi:DNA-binding response OmpR family regulator